ncbi:MAG: metallophosphoesterase family protein [Bacilli bacterium]|nr:metallophosphoesterase family protein [Bacilli bacterium]
MAKKGKIISTDEKTIENEDYSEELVDNLLETIKKEKNISEVSETLGLNDFEILGLVHDLLKDGKNIIVKQYDDGFHLLNQGDKVDEDISTYSFTTDKSNEFKFVAISDTRLGSKSQQLAILNDIYRKASDMGIHNVILCGNISAGLKPMTDTESNFIADSQAQVDYIVENYPKHDGITTYFISGKLDDKHILKNNINIGKRISDARDDMVYLGEDICDVSIDRAKMQVINSKLTKTYTASYRTQQTVDAYRSEDKPDILLYGGLLQMEKYQHRGVNCIAVPSVCATDNEMKAKRFSNTIGAWYVTVKTDEKGLLSQVTALDSPYYVSNKEDFADTNVSIITSSKMVPDLDTASIEAALKSYNYVRNNMSIDTYMRKFHISYKELQGLIYIWEMCGKKVDIVPSGKDMVFKKNVVKKSFYNKRGTEELNEREILVVSDTHFGNIHNQVHILNELYEEAYKRGVNTVFHIGDLTDGNYPNRPENPRQQFLHGFDEQVGYVVDMYPEIDGITTYYILGSHDETHYKNGQATVDFWVSKCRNDMVFLGQDTGEIKLDKVKYVLDHPGGGSAQSLSYKPQKRIEILESHNKPKVLLIGHYHKSYHFVYRNVQCVEVPALCAKTQFQQKQGLLNAVGGYFIKVYSDKNGNVQYFEPEEILYEPKDLWDEAGKDKRKVKKLKISQGIY